MMHHSPSKSDRADQTVSRRDLKLSGLVVLTTTTNVTEARPGRPEGGATASKSTKWLITPEPLGVGSSALYRWNPWLGADNMHASDWPVTLGRISDIWAFSKNLLLRTSPRFLARPVPNQRSKILWSLNVKSYQKKVYIWLHGP